MLATLFLLARCSTAPSQTQPHHERIHIAAKDNLLGISIIPEGEWKVVDKKANISRTLSAQNDNRIAVMRYFLDSKTVKAEQDLAKRGLFIEDVPVTKTVVQEGLRWQLVVKMHTTKAYKWPYTVIFAKCTSESWQISVEGIVLADKDDQLVQDAIKSVLSVKPDWQPR